MVLVGASVATALTAAHSARAGLISLKSCSNYQDSGLGAWVSSSKGAKMSAYDNCPGHGALQLLAEGRTYRSDHVWWASVLPAQMGLRSIQIPYGQVLVSPKAANNGYGLRFVWTGGSAPIRDTGTSCCGGMNYGTGLVKTLSSAAHYFLFEVVCNHTQCPYVPGQVLDVKGIELTATDNTPPTITPDETTTNIARAAGRWIRGSWDASFGANSDAGVCRAGVVVNGVVVARGRTWTPHTGSWTQCGAGAGTLGGSGYDGVSHTIDTSALANGPLSVEYYAIDPAQPANVRAPDYRMMVDNSPVLLSMGGPTQALSTQGPQSITANAAAGPSGISGIWCSVDGGPWAVHRASEASVQVTRLGVSTVACYARNNAIDATGATARSPVETWRIDIRKPAVSLISLVHVADALRCHRRMERVRVPGHWVSARYHGHNVRVWVPAQWRRVRVMHCHPRVRFIRVHRNGRTVLERVVELPHRVSSARERLAFGARPTVSGWLGGPNGDALPGETVELWAAPRNGSGRFRRVASTRTRSNGTWTIHLRAGPSRIIEASFAGTGVLASALSTPASISVRASPILHIRPSQTHWGDTIHIWGRLRGGYVPASGELVVLRIGWKGGSAEIGHVYTSRTGRFSAGYTFLRGTGTETYRIWAQTVRESDYPFTPASSKRVRIKVSS